MRKRASIRKWKFFSTTFHKKNPYTDINGNSISEEARIGYCHNNTHIGYVSHKIMKQHGCLAKQCPYFRKYEDHPYWINRAKINEKKKQDRKDRKFKD